MDLNDDRRIFAWLALLLGLAVAGYYLFSPSERAKRLCDDAIRAEIRTPASYDRIDAFVSDGYVSITYDAQNGYGAVVRGRGRCSLDETTGQVISTFIR